MTATLSDLDAESAFLAAIIASPKDDDPRLKYADWLDDNARDVTCERCKGYKKRGRVKDFGSYGYDWTWEKCPSCHGIGVVSDGRRERAEFIRVQCALANLKMAGMPSVVPEQFKHDPDTGLVHYYDLCRCERLLFRDFGPIWFADWPGQWRSTGDDMRIKSAVGCDALVRRGFVAEVRCTHADWKKHGPQIAKRHPVERVTCSDVFFGPTVDPSEDTALDDFSAALIRQAREQK